MVFLRIKVSEDDQFVVESSTGEKINKIKSEAVRIFNLRQKIRRLKAEGDELAQHGKAKPRDAQCIDTYSPEPVQKGEFYNMDPTGKRDGNACSPTAASTLQKTINEATGLLKKDRALGRKETSEADLLQAVDLIRGAVTIGYPMGLPEHDPVRLLLEGRDNSTDSLGFEIYSEDEMAMWFAGKEMRGEDILKDYVGSRETTTAIVRLVPLSSGAPSREPAIDEETYKGILAWSYKKQEEQKALEENEDDFYLDSEWSNPKSLKRHLNGLTNIKI